MTKRKSLHSLRDIIWDRDNGICQVCGLDISNFEINNNLKMMSFYECGHIVDHCVGGPELPSNLVVMCIACNRFKPLHEKEEEYFKWVKSGYWIADFIVDEKYRDMLSKYSIDQIKKGAYEFFIGRLYT